jgi:predicted ATPase
LGKRSAGRPSDRIDEALALAGETGEHWSDAFLHRCRGEIRLKRDPANTAPAEDAFLTAIAIAQQQKARSFELRAALALAKLYQSTGRVEDAHAVLASALKGFSPTPEFPEIEEAQALLAALAETDEVKKAAASRQRRLKLQTGYGQAVMLSRGFASDESKAAFTRARELIVEVDNAADRFAVYYGLWVGTFSRAELVTAQEAAESFRREAKNASRLMESAVGCRILGHVCLCQGDLITARANLEEALATYIPERDREAKFRFGGDTGALAAALLARTNWLLGDVGRAKGLIEEAVARAVESAHASTLLIVHDHKAMFELVRGDTRAAQQAAETIVELSREHGVALFLSLGKAYLGWARARLADRETGAIEFRQGLGVWADQGHRLCLPFFQGLHAELEAEGQGVEGALRRIDEGLAVANETTDHWADAFLHQIRGEILLKREPGNTAAAEEAFLTAIAVAQQQKARSFELRAALALANLYLSTGRPTDVNAVLAPALEGFLPTPEFPEIAEAQTLLSALAS